MKPFDKDGRELDASYAIELIPGGFDLVVESRGGSDHGPNASRNKDYSAGMQLHLSRMKQLDMILADLQVASKVAARLPEVDRRIVPDHFSLPLRLSAVDTDELRRAIGRASSAFRRTAATGGNPTKKLRLRMQWTGSAGMSEGAIERLLSRPSDAPIELEAPTSDPAELEERVRKVERQIKATTKAVTVPPPTGQGVASRATSVTDRFIRDPNVIAWVLCEAKGHCERCGSPAPFLRADGEPYLEVHHVRPLGEGGPDTTDNAIACCPNCHRQLHHDADSSRLRLEVIAAIPRLRDYPVP